MNKDLGKLLNPPWTKFTEKLQMRTDIASLAFQESNAMRSIRKLSEPIKLDYFAFSGSALMKSARIVAESNRLISLTSGDLDAIRSINQITKSSRFVALALQESEVLKSFRSIAGSTQLSAIAFQQFEKAIQLQNLAESSQFASTALNQSEAFKHISQLSSLASFKALSSLENSPFLESSALSLFPEMASSETLDESLIEIDAEISEEISSAADFNALSERTKNILVYLYHTYFLPVFLSFLSSYVMTNAVEARKETVAITMPSEAKAFVKEPNENFDRAALKGFRIITVNALNFRENPGVKSEIITTLPVGTLVEVIDKSDRSWLLVEVEIDGNLEQGWIFRRYTAYFK
ncbi:SH3 domain-containing protein [Saccharospirillum sp. HFRX-1]|uniref:SH3 domain-containing protein n=1 Tax=unclassified Saccharospirillum TaxID=2633430 RepID=UPI003719DAAA